MTDEDYHRKLKLSAVQQALRDLHDTNGNDPFAKSVLENAKLTRNKAIEWVRIEEAELIARQFKLSRAGRIRSWRSDSHD